jgi:pectate disaccharide-lyase
VKKNRQRFALIVSIVLLLSTMNIHVFAEEGSVSGDTWTFSAFGSNTSSLKNPPPLIHDDGSVTISASGGKLASGDEGLSYYFKTLPAEANFELKAKATVKSFNSNSSISTPNQKSFGLMLRDKAGENGDSSTQTTNYVAVGALDTVLKGFYKNGTQTKLNPFASNIAPTAGQVYNLSIKKSGNTYLLTSNNDSEVITVDSLFTDELFAGLYVARDAEVTFSEFQFNIGKEVTQLSVDSSQMKKVYFIGEDLNLTGLNVTAVYSDGSQSVLSESDYFITGFDSSQAGANRITLHHNGGTEFVDLTIKEMSVAKLEIKYYPAKTDYYVGDVFDPEGLVVMGEYENGMKQELSSEHYKLTISGVPISTLEEPGTIAITVTSTKTKATSTTFDVEVKDSALEGLKITQLPQKTQYFIGDVLDLDGMVVYASYDDGNEVRLMKNEYSISSLDSSTAGEKEITISYKGKTVALKVAVKEKELTGIEVTNYPKTTYVTGEDLDTTNLQVSKVYDNGEKEILAAEAYGIDALKFNNQIPGTYEIGVVPNDSSIKPVTFKVTIREPIEYAWKTIRFGQSTSTSANYTEGSGDGAIRVVGNGGKVTGDHDGITFYYTEIDAVEDNFTLSADIHVVDYAKNPHDGQESFGIMARDVIGEHGDSSVFASNIAAIGGFSGGTREANGTQFFVRTGVESPDGAGSKGIQKVMLKNEKPQSSNTYPKANYKLTLAKTNSGFIGKLDNEKEEIFFEPEILNVQDSKIYVGFYAARVATIEVHNIDFKVTAAETDAPKVVPPAKPTEPNFTILSLDKVSKEDYEFMLKANVDGTVVIKQGSNVISNNLEVKAGELFSASTSIHSNDYTNFSVTFLPNDTQFLTSYDKMVKNFTVTMKTYVPDGDIYVSPQGTENGDGTKDHPLDLDTAVEFVREGQKIILLDGHYVRSTKLEIRKFNDGTAEAMKYLEAAPGAKPVIDFNKRSEGVVLSGDYWHVKGIDFARSAANTKGFTVGGSYNIVENSRFYEHGDTGLQISRTDDSNDMSEWPSYNLILNSTSFDNRDPSDNNADGFAAKLTSGVGNIFRGCIAHNNIDDGWDLYTKAGSGAIGPVIIENSIAYRNGFLTDGTVGSGDKNGFKLGGEGIHVPHIIRNSMAFENGADGFTSNSNPGVIAVNNIAYNNAGSNLTFTTYTNIPTDFTIDGFISYQKGQHSADSYPTELKSDRNFMFDGKVTGNKSGVKLSDDNFASLEPVIAFERDTEGNIIWGDYLQFRVLSQVEFNPAVIKLDESLTESNAVVTVYLKLQDGFKLEDVKLNTIRLNKMIEPLTTEGYAKNPIVDMDSDGDFEYIVKFSRKDLAKILEKGDEVPITITGQLQSGYEFFGKTQITVK